MEMQRRLTSHVEFWKLYRVENMGRYSRKDEECFIPAVQPPNLTSKFITLAVAADSFFFCAESIIADHNAICNSRTPYPGFSTAVLKKCIETMNRLIL